MCWNNPNLGVLMSLVNIYAIAFCCIIIGILLQVSITNKTNKSILMLMVVFYIIAICFSLYGTYRFLEIIDKLGGK